MANPFQTLVEAGGGNARGGDWSAWAEVVSVNPVQVRVTVDGGVLDTVPDLLVPVTVGDVVRVVLSGGRFIVLGKRTKVAFPINGGLHHEHDVTFIDGVPYVSSGSVPVPEFTWTREEHPIYIATLNMPIPYVPPTGWTFAWSVQESGGWTFAQNGGRFPGNGTHAVRVTQFINAYTTPLKRLQWQLVRA